MYRATHKHLGVQRAIKSLTRGVPKAQRKQLLYEVKEMVRPRQDHPNILKIYEVIKDKEYYHVVTELLRAGNSLTGFRIESGTLRRKSPTTCSKSCPQCTEANHPQRPKAGNPHFRKRQ